jgi:hypothetical protein
VEYELTAVVNNFQNSFDRISTFVQNLGDNLYIMLSKSLQFSFPGVDAQFPDWVPIIGGATKTIVPAFDLKMGNAETRSAAANRVDSRNAKMHNRIGERKSDTVDAYVAASEARRNLMEGMQPIIINQDNRSTNTNAPTDRRTYVATGGATDGFNLNQPVQP